MAIKSFGARLYASALSGKVETLLQRSLDEVKRQGQGLRIRLHLDEQAPELAVLPWECLYWADQDHFLALSEQTPLVRYPDLPVPEPSLRVTLPLRILTVIASPSDAPPLQVEQEWERLCSALADLEQRKLVQVERLRPATLAQLQAQLRQAEFHILHFIGHGIFDPQRNQGGLLFVDEQGAGDLVRADQLATLLRDHPALRLAFLNACEGARSGTADAFAGIAPHLVRQQIPAVVAMQTTISDTAAITLAHEFYMALADSAPVDAALTAARKAVFAGGNDREWATPILFSRSSDNQLFALPTGDACPVIEHQSFEPETVLIPGGSFPMGSDIDAPRERPRHVTTLVDYRIGRMPVTCREYAAFLDDNRRVKQPEGWFNRRLPGKENHPVTGVSWNGAVAYCDWLSKVIGRMYRLPTEAEWEKAARGPRGLRYPWGNNWVDDYCNVANSETTSVDKYPNGASPYGCLDMLGNVQEWTSTLWGSESQQNAFPYPYKPDDRREDLHSDGFRIHRGGKFDDTPGNVRVSVRGFSAPTNTRPYRGFRVVMELQEVVKGGS
jgi:formylglycine-generating enzyme required for sulfatase activity